MVEGPVGTAVGPVAPPVEGGRPGAVPAWRLARTSLHPDESSGPPWLVTYSDLMTNLLVVFVMLVGIMLIRPLVPPPQPPVTDPDAQATPLVLRPFPATVADPPESAEDPAGPPGRPATPPPPPVAPLAAPAPPVPPPVATAPIPVPTPPDGVPVEAWASGVARWLWDAMATDAIAADAAVAVDDRVVTVRLGDRVLFDLGSADLRPDAAATLHRVGIALARVGAEVRVEGHTDDLPIATARFPSNWELSTARAAAVVRVLVGAGMAPSRLSVAGFADARPLRPEPTAEARAANRRVEIVVTPRP
jgi:chemotaxis protein MotB